MKYIMTEESRGTVWIEAWRRQVAVEPLLVQRGVCAGLVCGKDRWPESRRILTGRSRRCDRGLVEQGSEPRDRRFERDGDFVRAGGFGGTNSGARAECVARG